MAIRVKCGECDKAYQVKDEAAGKQMKCKECGATIRIPAHPKAQKPAADDEEEDLFADLAAAESRAAAIEDRDEDDDDDETPRRPARGKPKKTGKSRSQSSGMPASVMIATGVVGLLVLLQILGAVNAVNRGNNPSGPGVQVGIAGMILGGLIRGHRLAWQWGRIISVFSGVILGLSTLGIMAAAPNVNFAPAEKMILLVSMLVMLASVVTIFVCLGQDSAKEHFRLVCPDCGHTTNKANDFFFNEARCTHCGNVWS